MTASPGPADAHLVHGLGRDPVAPDWSPIADGEATELLERYGGPGGAPAVVVWRSPRPMSAAALVDRGGDLSFVKRHDPRVRSVGQLAVEHAFARHLRRRGAPVPRVRTSRSGETAVVANGAVYEVHDVAPGVDAYRDAPSWTAYRCLGHAVEAGSSLARFHAAAGAFDGRERPPAVLTSSCAALVAPDPLASVRTLASTRPGLARALGTRPWESDLARHLLPAARRAAPLLAQLPAVWGHGDWHPSNLSWTALASDARVAAILDLGLANRTSVAHDLAVALERSVVPWLDLEDGRGVTADLDAATALLDGYERVRPLRALELSAVAAVLPAVHLEYCLSELEYFGDVVPSPERADLAYHGYLVGHAAWFAGREGAPLLELLERRAAARR